MSLFLFFFCVVFLLLFCFVVAYVSAQKEASNASGVKLLSASSSRFESCSLGDRFVSINYSNHYGAFSSLLSIYGLL